MSVPRACLKAVRSVKESTILAGWERPIRTNSRVLGRVVTVLIIGFYWTSLVRGVGIILAVILV